MKKQVESNPVAQAKHMRLTELQSQLKVATSMQQGQPSLGDRLDRLQSACENLDQKLFKLQPKGDITMDSSGRASTSPNSQMIEVANMKLRYEELLEDKNQRINQLERKNQRYLQFLSKKKADAFAMESPSGEQGQLEDEQQLQLYRE